MKESLIIIRHGRSYHNVGATEDLDSELTDFGIEQAKAIGRNIHLFKSLKEYTFYVSPFKRCLQTAQYIREAAGDALETCNFVVDPNLIEYMIPGTSVSLTPDRVKDFPNFNWNLVYQYPTPLVVKGEGNEVFVRRINRAYEQLSTNSVVISHGLPCLALAHAGVQRLNYMPIWDYSINNCSITWIQGGHRKWYGRCLHHEL